MESVIYNFTEKMSELLKMEREAELDESAELLSKFSLKVLFMPYLNYIGIGKEKFSNN